MFGHLLLDKNWANAETMVFSWAKSPASVFTHLFP